MSTRTISVTEEAYECLRSRKKSDSDSFSQVIIRYFSKKRTLSDIMAEIAPDYELADAIESVVEENRKDQGKDIQI
jgi:predicted CopG family antitoxin